MNRKDQLLADIEKLKREKPHNWKRQVRFLIEHIRFITDDFREVRVNGDKMGYESLGRKCRSTRIQPPI